MLTHLKFTSCLKPRVQSFLQSNQVLSLKTSKSFPEPGHVFLSPNDTLHITGACQNIKMGHLQPALSLEVSQDILIRCYTAS